MQYVILTHRQHETTPDHFDLMLEREDVLWTWAWYDTSLPGSFDTLSLERIPDHRKTYLDYEGPIGEGRGRVEQTESGTYTLDESNIENGVLIGAFDGEQWSFSFRMERTGEEGQRGNSLWILSRE